MYQSRGMVVVLNAFIKSILFIYPSFMKILMKVCKQVVRLQRYLIWDGTRSMKKIAWPSSPRSKTSESCTP